MAFLNGSTTNADVRSSFAQYKYIGTQMSPVISGVTKQKFTNFLDDVATSSLLLMRAVRPWYCNSFSRASATNASGISRRWLDFRKINWLPWQSPLINPKTRYRSIICTQITFISWKDCENRSSISWYILLNKPVFCRVVPEVHEWALSTLELLDQSSQNFLHDIEASFTLLMRTLR